MAIDASHGRVLIAVATAPEYRCVAKAVSEIHGVSVRQLGPGTLRSTGAVDQQTRDTLTGLISAGTAAGIQPGLAPGTLLLPRRVLMPDDLTFAVDPKWHGEVERILADDCLPNTGDLLEVPAVLETQESKAAAFRLCGAVAADMESGSLAALARDLAVPFLVLRVVLDDAGDDVPPTALRAVDARGDIAGRALVNALLHRPRDLWALIRLMRRFAIARHALLRALARAAPALIPSVTVPD